MEIEFKRTPGDIVWVMSNDRPTEVIIHEIFYSKTLNCLNYEDIKETVSYNLKVEDRNVTILGVESTQVYDTKEELIKSL